MYIFLIFLGIGDAWIGGVTDAHYEGNDWRWLHNDPINREDFDKDEMETVHKRKGIVFFFFLIG